MKNSTKWFAAVTLWVLSLFILLTPPPKAHAFSRPCGVYVVPVGTPPNSAGNLKSLCQWGIGVSYKDSCWDGVSPLQCFSGVLVVADYSDCPSVETPAVVIGFVCDGIVQSSKVYNRPANTKTVSWIVYYDCEICLPQISDGPTVSCVPPQTTTGQ